MDADQAKSSYVLYIGMTDDFACLANFLNPTLKKKNYPNFYQNNFVILALASHLAYFREKNPHNCPAKINSLKRNNFL